MGVPAGEQIAPTTTATAEPETINVQHVLIPTPPEGEVGLPEPSVSGYNMIATQEVEVDGVTYEKYEFVPEWVNLSENGNGKRVGDVIEITE